MGEGGLAQAIGCLYMLWLLPCTCMLTVECHERLSYGGNQTSLIGNLYVARPYCLHTLGVKICNTSVAQKSP